MAVVRAAGSTGYYARFGPRLRAPSCSTLDRRGAAATQSTLSALPLSQKRSQVLRQGGIEHQPLPGNRVRKLQVGRMQELARRQRQLGPAIDGVADDRVMHGGEVTANLGGATSLNLPLQHQT